MIITPIQRNKIQECINNLYFYIMFANEISQQATLEQLEINERCLCKAWGMYSVLEKMDVLPDKYTVLNKLKEIQDKINMLKNDKTARPAWLQK